MHGPLNVKLRRYVLRCETQTQHAYVMHRFYILNVLHIMTNVF